MGTFLGSLPEQGALLEHTGKGTFQITNHDPRYKYWVVKDDGTSGGDVSPTGAVTTNTATASYILWMSKRLNDTTKAHSTNFYRQARTFYTYSCTQQAVNPCGDCNNAPGYWTWTCGCWGGDAGGGQWGPCICRKQGTCTGENTYPGYVKQYDEWVKIEAPSIDGKRRKRKASMKRPEVLTWEGDSPFINGWDIGPGEDREGYSKFNHFLLTVYDEQGKELQLIGDGATEAGIDYNEDFEGRFVVYDLDVPPGRGTYTIAIADTEFEVTYETAGEWRKN